MADDKTKFKGVDLAKKPSVTVTMGVEGVILESEVRDGVLVITKMGATGFSINPPR